MKKNIFYKVVLLAVLAIFITACKDPLSSNDDIVVLPPLTIDDVLALVNANYATELADEANTDYKNLRDIKTALEAAKTAGDVNKKNETPPTYTSLMLAARGNNLGVDNFVSYEDIVKALLRVDGIDIDASQGISNSRTDTALLLAIERKDVAVTEALLKAGAKHDISNPTASSYIEDNPTMQGHALQSVFRDLLLKYPNN